MTNHEQHNADQPTQPIPVAAIKRATPEQRFLHLKWLSEVTGRRFGQVYLEDEKRRKADHR